MRNEQMKPKKCGKMYCFNNCMSLKFNIYPSVSSTSTRACHLCRVDHHRCWLLHLKMQKCLHCLLLHIWWAQVHICTELIYYTYTVSSVLITELVNFKILEKDTIFVNWVCASLISWVSICYQIILTLVIDFCRKHKRMQMTTVCSSWRPQPRLLWMSMRFLWLSVSDSHHWWAFYCTVLNSWVIITCIYIYYLLFFLVKIHTIFFTTIWQSYLWWIWDFVKKFWLL